MKFIENMSDEGAFGLGVFFAAAATGSDPATAAASGLLARGAFYVVRSVFNPALK